MVITNWVAPFSCYPSTVKVKLAIRMTDRPGSPGERVRMIDELQLYVLGCISLRPLADRVVQVLAALPADVLLDLRRDEGFHLAMEDFQPGRGTKVWMPVAAGNWQESRSVVLRPRLNACREDFALYVIAHELAHAYLRNGGWGDIRDPELAADSLAAHWGFARPADWTSSWQIWRR